ncbi:hypothetical protein M0R45_005238 [Rubus argutus]|uniref:Cytochrome P450 n=1 Tax=Rubus argutus TaxID=59490 RepID=A0AAW1YM67_RUBAR
MAKGTYPMPNMGLTWRTIRKMCTLELLSNHKINSFKSMRKEELDLFIKFIQEAARDRVTVDLSAKVSSLNADMTCRMVFGRKYMNKEGLTKRMKAVSKMFDDFFEKIIDEHIQSKDDQERTKDFVDVMLGIMGSQESEYQVERSNIKAIILDMVAGAMDTSATAIEWTLSELIRHPRPLRTAMLMASTYPENHTVIINVWAIGRDPSVWTNPDKFIPERFVGSNIDLRGRDFQLLPFGSGRRGCPGMQLGLTVVLLVVAQLVHCFDWGLPNNMLPTDLDMTEEFGLTVPRAKHLLATPTYRL